MTTALPVADEPTPDAVVPTIVRAHADTLKALRHVSTPKPGPSAAEDLAAELGDLRARAARVHLADRLLSSPAMIERDGERQYLVVLSEAEWAAWNGLGS